MSIKSTEKGLALVKEIGVFFPDNSDEVEDFVNYALMDDEVEDFYIWETKDKPIGL